MFANIRLSDQDSSVSIWCCARKHWFELWCLAKSLHLENFTQTNIHNICGGGEKQGANAWHVSLLLEFSCVSHSPREPERISEVEPEKKDMTDSVFTCVCICCVCEKETACDDNVRKIHKYGEISQKIMRGYSKYKHVGILFTHDKDNHANVHRHKHRQASTHTQFHFHFLSLSLALPHSRSVSLTEQKFWSHQSTSTQPPILKPPFLSHEWNKVFSEPPTKKVTFLATNNRVLDPLA